MEVSCYETPRTIGVLILLSRLPRDFDRLSGNGRLGCFKLGTTGLLLRSLGQYDRRVIEFWSTCFVDRLGSVTGSCRWIWPQSGCFADWLMHIGSGDVIMSINQIMIRLLLGSAHVAWQAWDWIGLGPDWIGLNGIWSAGDLRHRMRVDFDGWVWVRLGWVRLAVNGHRITFVVILLLGRWWIASAVIYGDKIILLGVQNKTSIKTVPT